MQHIKTFFTFVISIVLLQSAFAQTSNKQISPLEKFFSQAELKVFYGRSFRPMNTSEYDEINQQYFDVQAKGKEYSIEGTVQVYKDFHASILFSKFSTNTLPFNLILPIDDESYFDIIGEDIRIIRKGMSVNYQKQFSKKSYSRFIISGGIVQTTYKNDFELEGNEGKFTVYLENKSAIFPFFTVGVSSAVIIPQLQVHLRYTRHFGTYDRVEDSEFGMAFDYDEFEVNSLRQNTFQAGLSWIFNFKNPLKVKTP